MLGDALHGGLQPDDSPLPSRTLSTCELPDQHLSQKHVAAVISSVSAMSVAMVCPFTLIAAFAETLKKITTGWWNPKNVKKADGCATSTTLVILRTVHEHAT